MAGRKPRPPVARAYFPVAEGITEHFRWLRGARLQVFLVILRHTNWNGEWAGWTVSELAREACVGRKRAQQILHELAELSNENPRRKYIEMVTNQGPSKNWLRVRKWIREAKVEVAAHPQTTKKLKGKESNQLRGSGGPGTPLSPPPVEKLWKSCGKAVENPIEEEMADFGVVGLRPHSCRPQTPGFGVSDPTDSPGLPENKGLAAPSDIDRESEENARPVQPSSARSVTSSRARVENAKVTSDRSLRSPTTTGLHGETEKTPEPEDEPDLGDPYVEADRRAGDLEEARRAFAIIRHRRNRKETE